MRKTLLYDEVVSSETAVLAKTAGFDADCTLYYCEFEEQIVISPNPCPKLCKIICVAPTQSLLQRWLREEKGVIVIPYYRSVLRMWSATYELTSPYTFKNLRKCFKTYELALEDALKYALENLVL